MSSNTRSSKKSATRNDSAQEDKESDASPKGEDLKEGETLMMRRVLVNLKVVEEEPSQRSLFRIVCKAGGKRCKFIVDGGSTKSRLLSFEGDGREARFEKV